MDANEIISMLNDKAAEFCAWLLPAGRKVGHEWQIGSLGNESGDSLKVRLDGDKVGVWKDFAQGDDVKGSNLVSLLMQVRGTTNWSKSLFECKEWLGLPIDLQEDRHFRQRQRNGGRFQTAANDHVALDHAGSVFRYLNEDRKLSATILARYRVRQHKGSATMAFCQATADKKHVAFVKYVDVQRQAGTNKKKEWIDPVGGKPGVWGKHAVDTDVDEIIITEGEIDAMSVAELGHAGVSAPMGAGNHEWIEQDWRWMEQFRSIVLLFDNDAPGTKAASEAMQKLINRLGRARCRLGVLPKGIKDANAALQQGRMDDLNAAILTAKSLDPAELKPLSEYKQRTYDLLFPPNEKDGSKSFFINSDLVFTRPGEITVWTGINSHGKTASLLHNTLHLADQGERILIACMEAPPHETARILCQQVNGARILKPKDFETAWAALEPSFWIYDSQDIVKREHLIETFTYAFRRYGVTQFVIDSFMTLDVQKDDYNGQSRLMDMLRVFAINMNVHVHLVAHARKGDSEKERPGKMDVSGHADITNKAFNGFTVWRNKEKEKKMADAMESGNEDLYEQIDMEEHDAELICWKQRHNGHEPTFKLWFNRLSLQYSLKPRQPPKRYLLPPLPPTSRPVTNEDFGYTENINEL